jgi:ribonuclease HI
MSAPTVHIDGAARGNPGPAAYALVLRRPGEPDVEEAEPIGKATNNVAEYTALLRALELGAELGLRTLAVFSDSELIVKQMNGEYRVKNAELRDLYEEAQRLRKEFDRVTIAHVRREENKDADRLCNEALDGRPRRRGGAPVPAAPPPPRSRDAQRSAGPRAPQAVEAEAVALLNAVAKTWAKGNDTPTAVEVWDRLWTILGDHGVVRGRNA